MVYKRFVQFVQFVFYKKSDVVIRNTSTFRNVDGRTKKHCISLQKRKKARIFAVIMDSDIKKKVFMPKIFEYFGFIFYFYSNEHEPIHVHVLHGARESVFELIMMNGELVEVRVREKKGAEPLSEKDRRTVEEFIRKYQKNIIDKWVKFFVLKQSIRSTNIKKKI